MFEDTKGNGGSANSGGGGGSLAGYATQAWVNEGFVSIDFFNRLFTVYGPGETSSDPDVVIEPNDLDSTIKNIKAMFGLWTEQYLSALGLNPGGTGSATSLSMLDDVDITTPTNGQALVYNATTLKWENQTISTVTALANLTDVLLTSPAANQVLLYNGSNWVNSSVKTINGYSIFGTGDIPASGGGTGAYLSIYGGQMYGDVYSNYIGLAFSSNDDAYIRLSSSYSNYDGFIARSGDGMCFGARNLSKGLVLDMETGKARFTHNIAIGGYTNSNFLLYNYGATYSVNGYDCNADTGYSMAGNIILRYNGNGSGLNSTILSAGGNGIYIRPNGSTNSSGQSVFKNNGYVGINTDSPSYTLHVSGTIYATGEITALSDIKQKNVEQYDAHLGFDEVANAPIIKFTWKDPKAEDKGLQVGSIAQYWEKVLPEAVKKDKEGTLSMSYGVVALVAAISTAKKVRELDERVTKLEKIER